MSTQAQAQAQARMRAQRVQGAGAPGGARGSNRSGRVGRRGEQVAADYLRHRGYRLLERNWRSPDREVPGELDLVLRHRGTLVICEVKARTGPCLAHPAEAVTAAKAARLRRLAAVWLREHPGHRPRVPAAARLVSGLLATPRAPRVAHPAKVRIDVVAVRLASREPFAVLGVDHLIGVA